LHIGSNLAPWLPPPLNGSFTMTVRNFLITAISATTSLAFFPNAALGQSAPQCTLEQISEALNQLDCTVAGAFISPESLVRTITTACEPTADEEDCHACFRKSGGKLGPALKALAKAKVFPKSSLSQFRIALVTAEETTCAAKGGPEEGENGEDQEGAYEPEHPQNPQPNDSRDQGRGRGQDDGRDRPQRPERPERP
jgi:hypothetical protein